MGFQGFDNLAPAAILRTARSVNESMMLTTDSFEEENFLVAPSVSDFTF